MLNKLAAKIELKYLLEHTALKKLVFSSLQCFDALLKKAIYRYHVISTCTLGPLNIIFCDGSCLYLTKEFGIPIVSDCEDFFKFLITVVHSNDVPYCQMKQKITTVQALNKCSLPCEFNKFN